MGAWSSVDRTEIESLRSVRNILDEYVQQELRGVRGGVPLPIAVFGPPGAGKTFAVRQLATVLLPGRIARLEYDLSQMRSVEALHAAFHEIRDVALRGDLALVFWDEFDSVAGRRAARVAAPLPLADGRRALPRRRRLPPARGRRSSSSPAGRRRASTTSSPSATSGGNAPPRSPTS